VASVKKAAQKAAAKADEAQRKKQRNSQAQDSSFFADLTSPPVTLNIMSVLLLLGTAGMVTHSKMDSEDVEKVDAKSPGLSLSLLLALALGCALALLRALALCPVLYCTLYCTSCIPHYYMID